jgi:hypothetical protein
MNFLEDLLVGHEFKFLSHKAHVHTIHEPCLAHSQVTTNNEENMYVLLTTCV